MKAKKARIFGVAMALVLAVALASVGMVQDTASADPDELEWTEITIPSVEGSTLAPESDVFPIAVSPDGGTLFAALTGVEPIAIGTLTLTITPAIAANLTTNATEPWCINYTAVTPGAAGNNITIAYLHPGVNNSALNVTVDGAAINVSLPTDGSANVSCKAYEIVNEVNLNASALVLAAYCNDSNAFMPNTSMAATNLTGGIDNHLVIFNRGNGGNVTGNLSASVTPGSLEGNLTVNITGTIEAPSGNVTGNFSFTVTGPKPAAITGNFTGALNGGCGVVAENGTFTVTVTGDIDAAGTVSGNFSGNHTANITTCDMSLGATVSGDVMVARALMKSTDDGYTWIRTGFDAARAAEEDGSAVVDIVVSPGWQDDDIVVVATQNKTYISDDRGVEFSSMTGVSGTITSLDAALDENGNLAMLAGSDVDVYLKTWVSGWEAQNVGTGVDVLDVAFSRTYDSDGQIVAVVTDGSETVVRAKFFEEAWAATITDATILDKDGNSNSSVRASIGFPDDYDALAGPLFVGIQYNAGSGTSTIGDVWRIDWSSTASVATDLNVRDSGSFEDTETDIYSIAVSGNSTAATILAGTEAPTTAVTPNQYLVHWSTDSGTSWLPSVTETDTKQPTGNASATVIMASPIAYVGTYGPESAFSASTSDPLGLSWNQRGLIDTEIDTINDIAPSPTYATDGTLYMATKTAGSTASLWRTTDEGDTWERILCSTLVDNTVFTMVELCEGGIFVASASKIYRSTDDDCDTCDAGTLFVKRITPRENIHDRAWDVVDTDTIYTGDSSGNVWKSTNAGLRWDKPDESDITGMVNSIAVKDGAILVGDIVGNVYICLNESAAFEFERVGPGAVDGGRVSVAFDVDYADNAMVYAGSTDKDIYRFVIDESTVWDEITPDEWAWSVQVLDLVAAEDGALYGLNISSPVRTVNPTEEDVDDINFELMDTELGLPTTTSLSLLEVVPGSNILFTANTTKLWIFEDTLTGKPTLASPSDGATSGDILEEQAEARVVLSWTEMEGAEWYQYEVALDEDLESVIANATGYVEGMVKDVELWLGTTYYWRVRVGQVALTSTAGAPLLSQWSDTWSFTTPLGPGAARPELESPEAGETAIGLMPVLEWSGLVDAVNYELMVARDCDWTDLAVDKTGDSALGAVTTYAVPSGVLAYDTDYCWKVKALSETTSSPWSDEGSFRTMTESAAAEGAPTAAWVWAVIAIGAILLIALIVFTVRTSRPV